jgi:2-keto-4-pentenoate hydratase/2-oxohepta-3-ene-1,7-dioic acid hydratase in catechol pathway
METVHLSKSNEDIIVPKIFCLGKNYAKHAAEMSQWDPSGKSGVPAKPIVFMKPSTAIVHDGAKIKIPVMTNDLHHETEIFFAIGKEGKNIHEEDARSFVSAMGVGLDLTLRDVQTELRNEGNPWLISKGFDGSAPISDAVPIEGVDLNSLELTLSVNGRPRQRGSYRNTIFKIEEVIAFISELFTLERGDLIFTGTPEGVAQLKPGDKLHAELVGYVSLDVEIV